MILQNGDVYEGEFSHNGLYHGKGVLVCAGDEYEGDMCQGRKHGAGRMNYASGDVYEAS